MVKIEINGQVIEAHEGDMLIDVADDAEIAIPRSATTRNCRLRQTVVCAWLK